MEYPLGWQSPIASFTPSRFPCSVSALKTHTWVKQRLFDGSGANCLCVELCNQTRHVNLSVIWDEPIVRWFKCGVSSELSFDSDKNWLEWRENQHPKCFPQWVLRMSLLSFHCIQAVFLLADPNWQVHTENNFLQCPSTENTHSGQTEPFHEGSGVNWLFTVL